MSDVLRNPTLLAPQREDPYAAVDSTERSLTISFRTAAFYWGYIIGVLPIALVLQRLPLAKALSILIFIWGVIVILTVTVHNYHGAIAQRFFLGLVESAVSPGFVLCMFRPLVVISRVAHIRTQCHPCGIKSANCL